MDKSPDAFRTISEVAEALETPAHVLRFWETRFPQIKPVKRAGGRRYYRPADVALLSGIKRLLHEEGLTIRGVQKILREQGTRHVSGLSEDGSGDALDLDAVLNAAFDGDAGQASGLTEESGTEEQRGVILAFPAAEPTETDPIAPPVDEPAIEPDHRSDTVVADAPEPVLMSETEAEIELNAGFDPLAAEVAEGAPLSEPAEQPEAVEPTESFESGESAEVEFDSAPEFAVADVSPMDFDAMALDAEASNEVAAETHSEPEAETYTPVETESSVASSTDSDADSFSESLTAPEAAPISPLPPLRQPDLFAEPSSPAEVAEQFAKPPAPAELPQVDSGLEAQDDETTTLATRLRALPLGGLAAKQEALLEIAARIGALRDRMTGLPPRG